MADVKLTQVELEIGEGDQTWGRILLELDAEHAPETVANFLQYVDDGFFDGTIFHRVVPGFMIQAGGHEADGSAKRGGLRPAIRNEAANGLKNVRGAIAMARTGAPHSATSQFFINLKDNSFLDYPGSDGWGYCAFGKVTNGMNVVDRIAAVETRKNASGERSEPLNPPVIRSARRV